MTLRNNEDEFNQTESRAFDLILNTLKDFVYQLDTFGKFIYANKPLLDLLKISLGEIKGKNFRDLNYPPDLANKLHLYIDKVVTTGKEIKDITLLISPAGKEGIYEYIFTPVFSSEHKVISVVGSTRDITERQQTTKFVEDSRQIMSDIFMQVPAIMAILKGPEHVFELANPDYLQTVGNRDVIGKTVREALPEIEGQGYFELLDNVYKTGDSFVGKEVPVKVQTGKGIELLYIDLLYQAIKNEAEKIVGILVFAYDVSKQVLTREAIEKGNQKYQKLVETIDQGFCVIEVIFDQNEKPYDYRFLEKNPIFEEQTGLKDAIGKTMLELVPSMEQHWFKLYGKVALTGKPVRFTEKSEGMSRWFECYAFRIGGPESRKVGVLFTDVTKRKQAEEALKESEERFRAIADDAPIFLFLAGENAAVEYLNKTWKEYTGVNTEDSKGRAWVEITHPDDVEPATKIYMDGFNKRESCAFENRQKGADGIYRTILWKATPRFSPNGNFIGMMGVGLDIHVRKKAEETLKESELLFRTLADQSPMIVFILEPVEEGHVSYWSKTWLEYTGQTFEQAIGRAWDGVVHPDDLQTVLDIYVPAFQNRQPYTIPAIRLRRNDGVYRWHMFKATPRHLSNKDFMGFVGVGIDIHDQKMAFEELELKNAQLVKINNDLDNFIYTASHDLKAPVSNIEGLLNAMKDIFKEEKGLVREEYNTLLEMMDTSIAKFKHTILDLTEISKVQKLNEEDIEEINLEEVLEDVKLSIGNEITDSKATIITNFSKAVLLRFSKKNIKSIIYNLLSNAIKYRDDSRETYITVSTEKLPDYIILIVKDNGLGIDDHYKSKIFSMFKRFHTHVEGTGIGLYIVKRIIDNANGKIEVESKTGIGSTFKVYFPLK